MDFKFSEEQEFFRASVKDAVDRLIRPRIQEIDEADDFPLDGKSLLPWDIWDYAILKNMVAWMWM